MTRQGPESLRGVGRAECGEAHFGNVPAQCLRRDLQAIEVRGLALIGGHPGGGVALDVLDRLEAFAHRQCDVFGGHVVLKVDKCLDPVLVARGGQCVDHQSAAEIPFARTGADAADLFVGLIGHISAQRVIPGKTAFAVRPQMHAGGPAAGHQQRVAGDPGRARVVVAGDGYALDCEPPVHVDHAVTQLDRNAQHLRLGQ